MLEKLLAHHCVDPDGVDDNIFRIEWADDGSAGADVKSDEVQVVRMDEDAGLEALVAALGECSVGSICGVTEGQKVADWTWPTLAATDCRIIAADFRLGRFCNTLERIVLAGHEIGTQGYAASELRDLGAAATSRLVQEIDLSGCSLNEDAIATLVASVRWTDSAIDKITVRQ